MARYIIRGTLLPMTDPQTVYTDGELLIDKDTIVAAGPRGVWDDYVRTQPDWQPERILNMNKYVIMPGLVNAHTHAAMTLLRGYADDMPLMPWLETKIWPFEALMTPDDMYWGTLLALCEMIRGGTTVMADMYMNEDRVADAVLEAGTRAVLSRGITALDPVNAKKGLQENLDLFAHYHEAGEGRVKIFLGPHAPYTCTADFLQEVKREADRLGTGIHIHVAETLEEEKTILERTGKRPVAWLEELGLFGGSVLAAHCVHVNEEDRHILKAHGVGVAHNPESNMKLNSGTAPVTQMLEMGIPVGLGTDGASSNNDLDMFSEMRSASFLQKLTSSPTSLPAYEVLKMATVTGCEILGLEGCGKLAPGYHADLIALDFDQPHFVPCFSVVSHLVYCARGADVKLVMTKGRILMEKGELTGLDEEKISWEAAERAKGIAQRL
ncbi:MAG: amidohydrolase [Peptococcaceae bacterium]|nr:amidohydrolase [Peptococcaceae bacterium]